MSAVTLPVLSDSVRIEARITSTQQVWASYTGLPAALIALGVATSDMLMPFSKAERRVPRFDSHGNRFYSDRYFVVRNGEPIQKIRIKYRDLPIDRAYALPGMREALAAEARDRAWWYMPDDEEAPAPERPPLRLVVDNTRKEAPPA